MTSRPDIPQDVIILIIEELSDDHASLAACALVARPFRWLCQKLLFATILINLSSHPPYAHCLQTLHTIITGHPALGDHVHAITIHIPLDELTKDLQSLSTLCMLHHLCTIKIACSPFFWIAWNELPDGVQSTLLTLMRSPYLLDIHLSWVNEFPTSYFTQCSQLKRIYLEHTSESAEECSLTAHTPNTSFAPAGRLETLIMRYSSAFTPFFNALSASNRLDRLRNLQKLYLGRLSVSDMPTCQGILDSCTWTLTSFGFELQKWPELELPIPDCFPSLTKMSSLRSIKIGFHAYNRSLILTWLQTFLRISLPSVNQLEQLTIELFRNIHLSKSLWNLFDRTLQTPTLATVHTTIGLTAFPPQAELLSFTEQNFPLLSARGSVSVVKLDESTMTL